MCKKLISMISLAWMAGLALCAVAGAADPSLVGWWKLDDASGTVARDSSGNNNGVLMEGAGTGSAADGTQGQGPAWTTGRFGGGLSFDGVNDYVNLAPTGSGLPAILAGLTNSSFAIWANFANSGGTWQRIWELSDAGGNVIFLTPRQGTSGPMRFGINAASGAEQLVDAPTTLPSGWHHITMTIEQTAPGSSVYTMYLDGAQVGQNANGTVVPARAAGTAAFAHCWLGRPRWQNDAYYVGLEDDFRIYNKTLSLAEIQAAMVSGPIAAAPNPGDMTQDVPRDAVLSWIPGPYASTHDVYLGTFAADVNTASRTSPKGVLVSQGQDANTYDPTSLLAYGQTYTWRVDEVNAPPDSTVFKGGMWSFTTETYGYPVKPVKATASSLLGSSMGPDKTIDGSGLDALDQHSTSSSHMWTSKKGVTPICIQYEFDKAYKLYQMWVWNSNQPVELDIGLGAKVVTIDTSLDGTTWTSLANVPEFAQATAEPNYVHNTTVDFGGVQARYVKLTIGANWADGTKQAGLAEVRFFYVPVKAFTPKPASNAAGVVIDSVLSWRPGREAAKHEVYLSTDPNAVIQGTALTKTVTEHSVGLGSLGLEYGRTYYWKVNEVNDATTPKSWEGDLWSFSTPDYGVVDDFESYNDRCSRIFFGWVDGFGYSASADCGVAASAGNGTGSTVGNTNPPFAEQTIVNSGRQSMPLAYDNTSGKSTSEAVRTFEVAQDWSAGGAKTLVVYFRGAVDNGAGQLYVTINGSKVSYNGSAGAIAAPLWRQWNIELASVSTNLKAVKTLAIGVSGSGKGILYIDDIRLYRSAPAQVQPVDPGTSGLAAFYRMEADVKDSSGKGYTGVAVGDPVYVDSLAGYGKALRLEGLDDYVDLPIGPLVSTLTSSSFTAWVNFANPSTGGWERIFDFGTGTTAYMFLTPRQGTTGAMTFAILTPTVAEKRMVAPATLGTGWHHVAVVIDGAAMTVTVYLDGSAVASGTTTALPKDIGKTTQNWLGRSQFTADGFYNGLIDEFRIYSRVLTAGEVRYLAGDR